MLYDDGKTEIQKEIVKLTTSVFLEIFLLPIAF